MVPTAAGKVKGGDKGGQQPVTNGTANGVMSTSTNGVSSRKYVASLADFGEPKELRIPVPYGHIAAKEWGPSSGLPVIGLHGWQDNAATFDLLVEHLPPTLHLIVIDFPGHGLSSHIPHGAVYNCMQFLVDLRRVVSYLGWTQFSLLGHSLGAIISFLYAAVHPEQVLKLVSIDILYPGTRPKDATIIRKFLENFISDEAKEMSVDNTFAHSEESALDLMWKSRAGLERDAARLLLKRGSRKTENGLVFTRDHRLKPFIMQPWEVDSRDLIFQLLKSIKTEVLVIVATDSPIATSPADVQKQVRDTLSESCKSFRYVELKGSHFIHMNDPAAVAAPIAELLTADDHTSSNGSAH